jgi:monoamine oxidase
MNDGARALVNDVTQGDPVIVDTIVIGAGFSGLAAALKLKRAGKSVLVVEARDRVGGRIKPGQVAGLTIDLGGMWQGSNQTRLEALADDYGCARYPTYLHGNCIAEIEGKRLELPGEDFLSALDDDAAEEVAALIDKIEAIGAALPANAPWAGTGTAALDGQTLASWLDLNARTPGARAAITIVTRSVLCAEPEQVSLLFFAFYLSGGNGFGALTSAATGGAQNFAFVGGMHQIADSMARDLGDTIVLSTPVQRIGYHEEGVSVYCDRGVVLSARRVIVAMPPPIAGRIDYDPVLPHARDALTQRMAMGSVIKAWIAYEEPFWRKRGLNGFFLSDRADFNVVFDMTPPNTPMGILSGFFDAGEATKWSARSVEARRREVLSTLVSAFGPEAANPIDYVETDWTTERWSHGCYGAFAPPGVISHFGAALREPVGRVHWAGTESSAHWAGYVEGAIRSGERAADEILLVNS